MKFNSSKFRRALESATLVAGLLGVGVWFGSIAESALCQRWQNWVFDHQLRGQPAGFGRFLTEKSQTLVNFVAGPGQRAPSPFPALPPSAVTASMTDRNLVGRLTIPRLHLTAIVREGTAEKTLRVALGHVPGTALPGMPGNIALAGHRDRLFRPLRQIRRGDLIRLESLAGTYEYLVKNTEVVWPWNVTVLRVSPQPELTLVTCYPFHYVGAAPKRFIVTARQISAIARPAPGKAAAWKASHRRHARRIICSTGIGLRVMRISAVWNSTRSKFLAHRLHF